MSAQQKKRPGRPPLPAGEKRLASIGFRPTPAMRRLLESNAANNDRSLAQEINSRLERSFLKADLPPGVFGGGDSVILAILIGSIMRTVKDRLDAQTLADPFVLVAIEVGIYEFFRTLREALPEAMETNDPKAGEGIEAGRKAADTFIVFARSRYDSPHDPAAEHNIPVLLDDIKDIIDITALRFSNFETSGLKESG